MTAGLAAARILALSAAVAAAGCRPAPPAWPSPPATFTIAVADAVREFPWEDDIRFHELLAQANGHGPVTVTFSPGVFEFSRGINLPGARDLTLRGSDGTLLRLRRLVEWGLIRTSAETTVKDKAIVVDRPDLMRIDYRYQLFLPDQRGGRFLECVVKAVEDRRVLLGWSSVTHPGLTIIPAGAYVLPEINFFDTFRGGGLTFENLTFDGNCEFREMAIQGQPFFGHTTHCGIVVRNLYRPPEPRPATRDVAIRRCRFRNLLGRGVAIYNVGGIAIEDCKFENVRTEALEIDHWSAEATVHRCRFSQCGTAIQLNDCNSTRVSACSVTRCHFGVRVYDALHDRTTNRGLVIERNLFIRNANGIQTDPFADDDAVRGNVFLACGDVAVRIGGSRNVVAGNVIAGSPKGGIQSAARDARIVWNVILPPGSGGDAFKAVIWTE